MKEYRCPTIARNERGFLRGGSFALPGPRTGACTALPVAGSDCGVRKANRWGMMRLTTDRASHAARSGA